jgi:hypothetical protein
VRVAAGLVAGQAVLCAVIGYVMLGGHGWGGGTNAAEVNHPFAASPMVLTPPAVPLPPPSRTSKVPETSAARPVAARPPAEVPSRRRANVTPTPAPAPARTPTAEPPAEILVGQSVPPVPPSSDSATVLPSASPPDVTAAPSTSGTAAPSPPVSGPPRSGVTAGETCAPVNASGVTTDGKTVVCATGTDGVSHWQTTN